MALEAGANRSFNPYKWDIWNIRDTDLERFFHLAVAAERERLATKFMEMHNAQQHRNNYFAFAARVIREET
jgi:hypothetical protein